MNCIKQLLIALLLFGFLAACNSKAAKPAADTPKLSDEPVRIIAIGRVEPELKITPVGSEVNGVVQKLYVHAGDSVKKGYVSPQNT